MVHPSMNRRQIKFVIHDQLESEIVWPLLLKPISFLPPILNTIWRFAPINTMSIWKIELNRYRVLKRVFNFIFMSFYANDRNCIFRDYFIDIWTFSFSVAVIVKFAWEIWSMLYLFRFCIRIFNTAFRYITRYPTYISF